ncbi:Aspartate/glutamate/uridylate kinase [Pelagophyceae sp. CCMP2097]|nr:Aspartate/glutamate/uridylate kinase [Pelagophyceae sp. CCMP2097]
MQLQAVAQPEAPVVAGNAAASPGKRVIMKFGGSSVANAERVQHVAALISSQIDETGIWPIVVVSAMGKTTNLILAAAERAVNEGIVRVDDIRQVHIDAIEILGLPPTTGRDVRQLLRDLESLLDGVSMVRELSPRTRDLVVSFGERMSVRVLAAQMFKAHNIPAIATDAWSLGVRTVGNFGDANVDEACYADIAANLDDLCLRQRQVPIVTGFIGHDRDGRVTTLGRGGSDLTATVLGAAGTAVEVQVWKDVDGMMSADPRVVENAVPVPFVTYEEAAELAYFGAQVLHPISMQPALRFNTPVRVKNSYNPSHPGTLIASKESIEGERAKSPRTSIVVAITTKRNITLVDIVSLRMLGQPGFLAGVFGVFERDGVSVDVVATSEVSVSLTLDKKQELSKDALGDLAKIAQVSIHRNRSIVSFIADVKQSTYLIARVFAVLHNIGVEVEMLSQGASKVNISLVVQDDDAQKVLAALHDCFFSAEADRPAFCAPLALK